MNLFSDYFLDSDKLNGSTGDKNGFDDRNIEYISYICYLYYLFFNKYYLTNCPFLDVLFICNKNMFKEIRV